MKLITPENDRTLAFEETELAGVLPSILYVVQHLEQFDDQFAVAIKHLGNAAKQVYRVGMES